MPATPTPPPSDPAAGPTSAPIPGPRNPLIPGFHPDPSVVQVGGDYYLANSTFEYLPGIPIHRSRDLVTWEPIGHVATTETHLASRDIFTGGGAWAPTIRHHDGLFHLAVTDTGGRGTVVFTASDAAGPWSQGVVVEGLEGIDPDLAWDEDGTCYMTFSAMSMTGAGHGGIQQARIDPLVGKMLTEPRRLWSGTGLMFPEGPHLYRIGDWWYLLIAEGGTERGHAVSIARSASPEGPFEACPGDPLLTAAGTDRPIQNTGHGDLVRAPDGSWYMVLLGMRVRGGTRSFSPMGRETFCTPVTWDAAGWPSIAPVVPSEPCEPVAWTDDFSSPDFDARWLGLRALPASIASRTGGRMTIAGRGTGPADMHAPMVAIRQEHFRSRLAADVDASAGAGGVCLRYDETHWLAVESDGTTITATAHLSGIAQSWSAPAPGMGVGLWIATDPVALDMAALGTTTAPADDAPAAPAVDTDAVAAAMASVMSSDTITLGFDGPAGPVTLASVDGRYFTAEVTCSFTGRVYGLWAREGIVAVTGVSYTGRDD